MTKPFNPIDPNDFNRDTAWCQVMYDFLSCATQLDDGNFSTTKRVSIFLYLRLQEVTPWSELKEVFKLSSENLWAHIDVLVQMGMVEKIDGADVFDQRKKSVRLTDHGFDRIEMWLEGKVP